MHKLINPLKLVIGIALIGLFCFAWYLQLIELFKTPSANSQPQQPTQHIRNQPAENAFRDIPSLHLFGDAKAQPLQKEIVQKDLPKTNLKLILTGVSAGVGDRIASALIQGPNKETLLYKVGDSLPGNATLNNIYDDRVVIKRSGRLENLLFPKVSKGDPLFAKNESNATPSPEPKNINKRASPIAFDPAKRKSLKDKINTIKQRYRSGQR